MMSNGKGRLMPSTCNECEDKPDSKCQSCGCKLCASKEEENLLLICDGCNDMYHTKCLTPPLLEVPQEDWYCPECKNDENEIVKPGDKLKTMKKRRICKNKDRKCSNKMACVRKRKPRYVEGKHHKGPIAGIDVGTTWRFRKQLFQAGVHISRTSGMHGRKSDCAYSIVLSGGYGKDYDNGDEFLYSGAGGKDFSVNNRINVQSKDQTLTKMNLALAKNCNARINDRIGAEASNWEKGKPVRVIRNYKLRIFSKYAPKEGNRYDGIYKVVRYYPDRTCGFLVWKYVLRRDDLNPAPWTEEGKARIAFLGLKMLYPDRYNDTMEKGNKTGIKRRSAIDDKENNVAIKKIKPVFDLDDLLKTLIENDQIMCDCCLGILYNPVTIPCGHNFCLKCLKRRFDSEIYFCPTCQYSLNKTYDMKINQTLSSSLLLLYPRYKDEQ